MIFENTLIHYTMQANTHNMYIKIKIDEMVDNMCGLCAIYLIKYQMACARYLPKYQNGLCAIYLIKYQNGLYAIH